MIPTSITYDNESKSPIVIRFLVIARIRCLTYGKGSLQLLTVLGTVLSW